MDDAWSSGLKEKMGTAVCSMEKLIKAIEKTLDDALEKTPKSATLTDAIEKCTDALLTATGECNTLHTMHKYGKGADRAKASAADAQAHLDSCTMTHAGLLDHAKVLRSLLR